MRKDHLTFVRTEHEISDSRTLYRYEFETEPGLTEEPEPKVSSNDAPEAEESAPE